jgi:DNA polymerase
MAQTDLPVERIRKAALQQLESLQRAGAKQLTKPQALPAGTAAALAADLALVSHIPGDASAAAVVPGPAAKVAESASAVPAAPSPPSRQAAALFSTDTPATTALPPEERRAALEVIRRDVAACTLCEELARTRTQTVFGVGTVTPRVCFFGEAPGADEDKQGEPFVGRAGQLLNKIIDACGWKREEVYILNTLKCRPPGNRNPLPDEAANCRHFWERQLATLRPEYVVCLGAIAAQTVLQTTQSIGRLRSRLHDFRGMQVLVTYHPAYLLRNPDAKRDVWEDMKFLLGKMGLEVPPRQT